MKNCKREKSKQRKFKEKNTMNGVCTFRNRYNVFTLYETAQMSICKVSFIN